MSDRECDGCGTAPATIRVYQTKGADFVELWLCSTCARSLGVEEEAPVFAPTIGELLGSLVGDSATRTCPECGTRFRTIRQTGRAGCPECYRVFHARIEQLLEGKGLTETHQGRYPSRLDSYKRLLVDRESLRDELNTAVIEENYEQAALIRDRMRALEEQDADI
jgi:protein arginine kinase activator